MSNKIQFASMHLNFAMLQLFFYGRNLCILKFNVMIYFNMQNHMNYTGLVKHVIFLW